MKAIFSLYSTEEVKGNVLVKQQKAPQETRIDSNERAVTSWLVGCTTNLGAPHTNCWCLGCQHPLKK